MKELFTYSFGNGKHFEYKSETSSGYFIFSLLFQTRLTDREKYVIARRLLGRTFKEIGETMFDHPISNERVRQIEAKGLRRLRHPSHWGRRNPIVPIKYTHYSSFLETPLEKIRNIIPLRIANSLHNSKYETIEQVERALQSYDNGKCELLKAKNIGKKSVTYLIAFLKEMREQPDSFKQKLENGFVGFYEPEY